MINVQSRKLLSRSVAASLFCLAALSGVKAEDLYGPISQNARNGGTLTMGSLVEPPGLDPFHQGADARIRVTVLVYQGLFYEATNGEAMPLLAESYEASPDKLVYTIKLRQGVKFHTGQPMTAKDVAYSYNYIRDPKNGSPGAGDFGTIKSIDVVDDHTVKITLSEPNASLLMTLGNKYGAVIPAGYFDAPDSKTKLNQTSVGTGPFKLTEFKPNSNLTLAKNADYWEKGAPYVDKINFVFVPNSASMLVGLTNKRIDLASLTRPQDVKQVERVPDLKIERWPSLNQKAIDLGSRKIRRCQMSEFVKRSHCPVDKGQSCRPPLVVSARQLARWSLQCRRNGLFRSAIFRTKSGTSPARSSFLQRLDILMDWIST